MYRTLNILSIDVAAGAVICCAFFAHFLGVTLLPHAFIALGLTVWIIYTTDHLIDAHRISAGGSSASTERHRYHQKHFGTLLVLVVGASFIVGLEVFFLRKPVLYAGMGLALLVLGYMFAHQRLKHVKELVGAILYTTGVIIAPISLISHRPGMMEWALIGLFALTALTNLLLFSWFGRKSDEMDKHTSFATTFGEQVTRKVLLGLFIFTGLSGFTLVVITQLQGPWIILLTMNGVLLLIFLLRNHFALDDRYRLAGDSIFLIPLFYLVFSS